MEADLPGLPEPLLVISLPTQLLSELLPEELWEAGLAPTEASLPTVFGKESTFRRTKSFNPGLLSLNSTKVQGRTPMSRSQKVGLQGPAK